MLFGQIPLVYSKISKSPNVGLKHLLIRIETPLCSGKTSTVFSVKRLVNSASGILLQFSHCPLTKFAKLSIPIKSMHADSINNAVWLSNP
tara:strand:- start:9 stop:278 length:270 start_codon:yes stop_codon:yes gene_type:complete